MLLACFHRTVHYSHNEERLIWLYDIHLLAESMSENEFHSFYDKASKFKIITLCKDAITNARDWFNTSLPEWYFSRFNLPEIPETSATLLQPGRLNGIYNRALFELKDLSTWPERVKYLLEKIFPSESYMTWRYNIKSKFLLPFYYLYRIFYGLFIFIKGQARVLRFQ